MLTIFRRAELPKELRSLMIFDRKVFGESDRFDAPYWQTLESYWLLEGGVKVGCCAFERNVAQNSLYIATTGIHPGFQGRGFGRLMKAWEVAFARHHGFKRIVTNCRKRNTAMIRLNKNFGFKAIRTEPRYYSDPVDSMVVMELRLAPGSAFSRV